MRTGLGVIHRDIKPSNIMLCDGGRTAKILDFGIARMAQADRARAEATAARTQFGQVLGTPRYMSPEQAFGLELDHRSDLFSLGVVLYELITGQTAFAGTSIATLALQITQRKPEPLGKVVPGLPARPAAYRRQAARQAAGQALRQRRRGRRRRCGANMRR